MKQTTEFETEFRTKALTDPLIGAAFLARQLKDKDAAYGGAILDEITSHFRKANKPDFAYALIQSCIKDAAVKAYLLAKHAHHYEEHDNLSRAGELYNEAFELLKTKFDVLPMFIKAVSFIALNSANRDLDFSKSVLQYAETFLKERVIVKISHLQLIHMVGWYQTIGLEAEANRLFKELETLCPELLDRLIVETAETTQNIEDNEVRESLQHYIDAMTIVSKKLDAKIALASKLIDIDRREEATQLLNQVVVEAQSIASYERTSLLCNVVLAYFKNGDIQRALEILPSIQNESLRIKTGVTVMMDCNDGSCQTDILKALINSVSSKQGVSILVEALLEQGRVADAAAAIRSIPEHVVMPRLELSQGVIRDFLNQNVPKQAEALLDENEACAKQMPSIAPAAGRLAVERIRIGNIDAGMALFATHQDHVGPRDVLNLMGVLGEKGVLSEDLIEHTKEIARMTRWPVNRVKLLLAASDYLNAAGDKEQAEAFLDSAVAFAADVEFLEELPILRPPQKWRFNPDVNLFTGMLPPAFPAPSVPIGKTEINVLSKLPYYGISLIAEFARQNRYDAVFELISKIPKKPAAFEMLSVVGMIYADQQPADPNAVNKLLKSYISKFDIMQKKDPKQLLFG